VRRLAGAGLLFLLLAGPASAGQAVAPDDPALIKKMSGLCLKTALGAVGIDRSTRSYCDCVAPIFARHMTPASRYRLTVENRMDLRPEYDDAQATYDDVVKNCPPGN
jgi:hypothetical protein